MSASPSKTLFRLGMRIGLWARRVHLARWLAIALAACSLVSGILTMLALFEIGPVRSAPETTFLILNADLVFLLALAIIVGRRLVDIFWKRRRGAAGSRLQSRLVLSFAILAIVPTILVGTFSAYFFHKGVQGWFSERVRTAVHESLAVADAYLKEHRQAITGDALAISQDFMRNWNLLFSSTPRMDAFLRQQSLQRGIDEAVIFDRGGNVMARAGYTFSLHYEDVPFWALERADRGEVALLTGANEDRIRALLRLDVLAPNGAYLYVGRFVDPAVIAHTERAQKAVSAYQALELERWDFEITFTLVYILVSLLLVLLAMWLGLTLSYQLVEPISALIEAAEKTGKGDLSATVREFAYSDEISVLSRTFNRMIRQLGQQRKSLLAANQLLDSRRRFTEAVLTGVSAGVLGLDAEARVRTINPSAARMLDADAKGVTGAPLASFAPELDSAFTEMRHAPGRQGQKPVTVKRDGHERILLVRVSASHPAEEDAGFVLTFDDVTELQAAQRAAAWSDVARRIAHEIKNPLTPIQLSAERLQHKYLKRIGEGEETFRACTETIVRQVEDIRRLVDEFSSFARMPTPNKEKLDLNGLVRQTAILQKTAFSHVEMPIETPDEPVWFFCDRGLMAQALTNILKNAMESIEEKVKNDPKLTPRIAISVTGDDRAIRITVADNGIGFPKDGRERLTDPYVTTRSKGTGLGLAIVKKIVEDHGGRVLLKDNTAEVANSSEALDSGGELPPTSGARVVLEFPLEAGSSGTGGTAPQRA